MTGDPMTRQEVTFLLAGLTAGITTTVVGHKWPGFLAFGVGLVFFVAVLAAIALTKSWPLLNRGLWRIVAALCICTLAYLLALFTFFGVAGYWAKLLGIRASTELRFSTDVWIGLLAAGLVASVGIEFLVYVLTGKWNNSSLFRLAAAGVVTILVTFTVHRADHLYWTFYGVLLPIGEGLFCAVVGAQIWRTSEEVVRA
jgi:hypothetical protein